jgi:hypothetical protein
MPGADPDEWLADGSSAYLRELENAHAVDVGRRVRNEDAAIERAITILRNARILHMSHARAAELAVLVLMAWQSRAVLGDGHVATPRLWEIP